MGAHVGALLALSWAILGLFRAAESPPWGYGATRIMIRVRCGPLEVLWEPTLGLSWRYLGPSWGYFGSPNRHLGSTGPRVS